MESLERSKEGKLGDGQGNMAGFLVDLTAGGKDGGVHCSFEVDRRSILACLLNDEMVDLISQFASQLQEREDAVTDKGCLILESRIDDGSQVVIKPVSVAVAVTPALVAAIKFLFAERLAEVLFRPAGRTGIRIVAGASAGNPTEPATDFRILTLRTHTGRVETKGQADFKGLDNSKGDTVMERRSLGCRNSESSSDGSCDGRCGVLHDTEKRWEVKSSEVHRNKIHDDSELVCVG